MKNDRFGRPHYSLDEIADHLYINPELDLGKFEFLDWPGVTDYNVAIIDTNSDLAKISEYKHTVDESVPEFDARLQNNWYMPDEYKKKDIANWIRNQAGTDEQRRRVDMELALFEEKNLLPLLRYLKYLVDTMRKNNIVWGVGRGSSVASYVLFLIGVHKVDSLKYDLPIEEFLR